MSDVKPLKIKKSFWEGVTLQTEDQAFDVHFILLIFGSCVQALKLGRLLV